MAATLALALAGPLWADAAEEERARAANDQFTLAAKHYERALAEPTNQNLWRLALDEFDAFLSRFADHSRANAVLFYSGETLAMLGRHADAGERFEKFLKAAPEHKLANNARFRVGESAYLTGESDQAIEFLQAWVEQNPMPLSNETLLGYHESALPYLGELYLARGDAKRAEAAYSQSLKDHPRGRLAESSRLGLARASEQLGSLEDAGRFYRLVADLGNSKVASEARYRLGAMKFRQGAHAEAEKVLADMLALDAESSWRPSAQYWLARAQIEQKKWEQAHETLQAIPEVKDASLAPAVEFAAGQTLVELKQYDEAAERLQHALDQWPESEWADDSLQLLAEMTLRSGDHERLEKLADTFAKSFPGSPLRKFVRRAWGRSLLKQERFDEAKLVFAELTGKANETPHAADWHCLGLAHLGAGKYEESLAALDKVQGAELAPELRDAVTLARATALIGLKRWEEAIEPLKAHLTSQPKGPDVALCRARLVWCLAETGQIDEAAAELQSLAHMENAKDVVAPATRRLAQAAQAQGKGDLAKQLWESLATTSDPTDAKAEALSSLAWMSWEKEDFTAAAAAFARLTEEHPQSPLVPEALYMQGRSLEKSGKADEALTLYERVLSNHVASQHAGQSLLAAARLRQEKGDKAKAAELLETLITERPDDPQIDAALCQRAWLLFDLDRAEEAEAVLDRIVRERRESPYWADAACRVAERAIAAGDQERAATLLGELVGNPQERPRGVSDDVLAHALYLHGQTAAAAERWSDAAAAMRRLIEETPQSSLRPGAEFYLAEAHYRLQEFDQAGERFAALNEQTAEGKEPWMAMIPLRHAQILAHQEKWTEAFETASKIAERFPEFRQQYEADYLLGRCLASQARFDEARAAYERVVRSPTGGRTETAAMAQWMIGETYLHQKNYHEAIRAYFRVERLFAFPRWQAAALLQAGKCHEAQSNWPEASRLYAQLLREHPGSAFEEEASQRLQRGVAPEAESRK